MSHKCVLLTSCTCVHVSACVYFVCVFVWKSWLNTEKSSDELCQQNLYSDKFRPQGNIT